MDRKTHYPSFDIMREKDHWDDHTQRIVTSRLEASSEYRFLKKREAAILQPVCSLLTGESRKELIRFVLFHIDRTLASSIGEGQREPHVPKAGELVRKGLKALDQTAEKTYGRSFTELDRQQQKDLLSEVSRGQAPQDTGWEKVPQVPFFKKMLNLSVEACYSHPTVWSEIGYGGPAYPRGYVRTQLGQLDPWEAQPENE
ncbi:gluconate 2-dehydrogenase subunit 3 family protein [Salinithrix halophila]|uniref:Gluconate 2-dehydrogenase subunit 3 family protein n=1 Tax=Salinithrix halophila TaxID=1485204 RepID=A0ABV8JEH0_9BACL